MQDFRYHCPTYCVLKFKKHLAKAFLRKICLFENGDYNAFRQAVSDYDWNTIIKEDVNLYANALTQTLINLSEQYIPNKNVTIRPQDLPWINNNIRKLMRKRNRSYRKYKRSKTVQNYSKFKRIRNDITSLLRKSKQDYTESLANKLKSSNLSSKDYWNTLKSFIKPAQSSSEIPPLHQNGCYVSDSTDKANLLNEYFVQQTSLDERSATIPAMVNIIGPTLTNINFTSLEVKSVLESLQLGKSSGPDGINNRILKELSSPLSTPLSHLFNYSMSKGIFPDIWKEANVSPLFKKDDPSSVSNYRPISLLNTIGKVMEKLFTNTCLTSF